MAVYIEQLVFPILLLLAGALIHYLISKRLAKTVRLVSYLGASAVHRVKEPPAVVHTHSIVIGNNGREAATNVRIRHAFLPANVDVYPETKYEVIEIGDTVKEMVFDRLRPGKYLTISYLYFPPILWRDIHDGIECDQGAAKVINMGLSRQFAKSTLAVLVSTWVIGAIATVAWIIYWFV